MTALRRICVYCGRHSGNDPAFATGAQELGRTLAQNRIGLVYGGGSLGLMGALARSTHEHGGEIIAVIPQFLQAPEQVFALANEIIITGDMHERKRIMFDRADAFIALPGGIGTLEELLEQLTWAALGHHKKPVVLANVGGYWGALRAVFALMAEAGFSTAESALPYTVCDAITDIIPTLQAQVLDTTR
jgi:uncharacterized protein (TIGR00730 family)